MHSRTIILRWAALFLITSLSTGLTAYAGNPCPTPIDTYAGDAVSWGGCYWRNGFVVLIPCIRSVGDSEPPWLALNGSTSPAGAHNSAAFAMSGMNLTLTNDEGGHNAYAFTNDVIGGFPCAGSPGFPGGVPPGIPMPAPSCGLGGAPGDDGGGGPGKGGPKNCTDCTGGGQAPIAVVGSISLRFPIGDADQYHTAGVLRLYHDGAPANSLGDPNTLKYDFRGAFHDLVGQPVEILPSGADYGRQYRTRDLLANIEIEDSTTYWIKLYPLSHVSAELNDGLYDVDPNTEYRAWRISFACVEDPNSLPEFPEETLSGGSPCDPNQTAKLIVREYHRDEGESRDLRAVYVYVYDTDHWNLERLDSGYGLVQREIVTGWTQPDPNIPVKLRTFTVRNAGNQLVYQHLEEVTDYNWDPYDPSKVAARRTALTVDPNGTEPRTTRWTYVTPDPNVDTCTKGVTVQSVTRPDGSWTWYNIRRLNPYPDPNSAGFCDPNDPNDSSDPNESHWSWLVETINGFKDAGDPNSASPPSVTDANVHATRRVFARRNSSYMLCRQDTYMAGELVGSVVYDHDVDPDSLTDPNAVSTTTEYRWASSSDEWLTTVYHWKNYFGVDASDDLRRISIELLDVTYPDGRKTVYERSDDGALAVDPNAAYPAAPTVSGGGGAFRSVTQTEYGSVSGTPTLIAFKSTRRVTVTDGVGRPHLQQLLVYDGGSWNVVSWAATRYDQEGRVTERWSSDGSHEETEFFDCCTKTVTDAHGVKTTTSRDILGRLTSSIRQVTGQEDITTSYDYDTARQTTVTITAGTLSDSAVTTVDMWGRVLSSVRDAGSSGAIATAYVYTAATSTDGEIVAQYLAYDPNASATRDVITEYYRDGNVKAVSGAAAIESHFDYGATDGLKWREVKTGDSGSTRIETVSTDSLGRTISVARKGWSSGGSPPDEVTTYAYDDPDTGRLLSVTPPSDAATLFAYDEMGRVLRTVTDVDASGTIGLTGPDRVNESETLIENDSTDPNHPTSGDWWRVTHSRVYVGSSGDPTETGSQWMRLSGYSGSDGSEYLNRESMSLDIHGNATYSRSYIDRTAVASHTETNIPESSTTAVRSFEGSRLVESVSSSGVIMTYGYDDFGRQTSMTDGRGNTTATVLDDAGRVETVTDADGNVTSYTYFDPNSGDPTPGGDGGTAYPGRIKRIAQPYPGDPNAALYTYFAYNERGQTTHTWGNVPYPTETIYDEFGQRVALNTFRGDSGSSWSASTWPSSIPSPGTETTTWTYNEATGLLNAKTYADSRQTTYTYSADGKMLTRVWARSSGGSPLTTTYHYYADGGVPDGFSGAAGELSRVTYSDATPSVAYSYDRLGRRDQVSDAAGIRVFEFDPNSLEMLSETIDPNGLIGDYVLTQTYQGSGGGLVPGRWSGVKIGESGDPNAFYTAGYGYDAYGRLNHVTGPGLPTGSGVDNGAWYLFLDGADSSNTDLVSLTQFRNSSAVVKAWTERAYDPNRDVVDYVANVFGEPNSTDLISKYDYANDELGRRSAVVYSGAAFSSDHMDLWTYNNRSELTGTTQYTQTDPNSPDPNEVVADSGRAFVYDSIGNRKTSNTGANPQLTYVRNNLNQYTVASTVSPHTGQAFAYDDDGNLIQLYVAGDLDGDGDVDLSDLALGWTLYGYTYAEWIGDDGDPAQFIRADNDHDGIITLGDVAIVLAYYGTGSTGITMQEFTWDAENRLTSVTPLSMTGATPKVTFKYDYQGRRIEKAAYDWDPNSGAHGDWKPYPTETRRFVWYNWLMLMEVIQTDGDTDGVIDPNDPNDLVRTKRYTWGRDLGGGLESAGGIGGLLAVYDDNATTTGGSPTADDMSYLFMYDANGNVGQIVDPNEPNAPTSLVATYEYDAYGGVIASDGAYDTANTYRFSTKPWNDETGLGYWGHRYYGNFFGRWLSRDRLEESASSNLFLYVFDCPTTLVDPIGDQCSTTRSPPVATPCGAIGAGYCFDKCTALGEYQSSPPSCFNITYTTTCTVGCFTSVDKNIVFYAKCNCKKRTCQCMCMSIDGLGRPHGPYPVGRIPRAHCETFAMDNPGQGYTHCYCRD